MDLHITFSRDAFRTVLRRLAADPSTVTFCPAGLSHHSSGIELLVSSVFWHRPACEALVVVRSPGAANGLRTIPNQRPSFPEVVLEIGGPQGQITVYTAGDTTSMTIRVIQPGLPVFSFSGAYPSGRTMSPAPLVPETWSRTIGALGIECWSRLRALRFAVIGCGRTGSLMAASLARLGVEQLTLIDTDRLEAHNLGEMDSVTVRDIGKFKVDALQSELARIHGIELSQIVPLRRSIFDLEALAALRKADFLVCSVDSARARRAVDFISRLFLKPILDIGAAVLGPGGRGIANQIGADVRLVSPGRCLHCFGGIREVHQRYSSIDKGGWKAERAGSLRSLNQIATGIGMRLIEEYMGGRLESDSWIQIDFTSSGLPQIRNAEAEPVVDCQTCRITGQGDQGFHLFRHERSADLFRTLAL